MENQQFIQEDEIDLRECINVIIKRKKLILSLVFASVIITAVLSFLTPKTYTVSMILEPPIYGITADAGSGDVKVQYLDSANNIAEIIKSGAFDSKIIGVLNLQDKGIMSRLKVSQTPNTFFLKVYLDQPVKLLETGKKILNTLCQQISSRYQAVINNRKEEYIKQIENINNDNVILNNEINQRQRSYKILEERRKSLNEESREISENTGKLLLQRESLLKTSGSSEVSSLLFTTVIQQNIGYSNQLNNELSVLRTKGEETLTEIKNLQNDIDNKRIEIEKNNLIKDRVSNIKMIQEPTVSPFPVGPRKIGLVAIAGIVSFMLGLFLAFFMESWQKGK
jgi:uncharacterized protein involved in exopolysaccharide biosynthesis